MLNKSLSVVKVKGGITAWGFPRNYKTSTTPIIVTICNVSRTKRSI